MEFVILVMLLGLIPAMIASKKGKSFFLWWIYGTLLFIIALVHALLMNPDARLVRKCPHCAENVKVEANVCPHCQRDIIIRPSTAAI